MIRQKITREMVQDATARYKFEQGEIERIETPEPAESPRRVKLTSGSQRGFVPMRIPPGRM